MENKTIIDSDGYILDFLVLFKEGEPQDFELTENMIAVDFYNKNYVKPKWNGSEWIEGATEEEIQAWREENKVIEEPSENDVLISSILLENAEKSKQINDLEELTSTLMLQIAELKGGNESV